MVSALEVIAGTAAPALNRRRSGWRRVIYCRPTPFIDTRNPSRRRLSEQKAPAGATDNRCVRKLPGFGAIPCLRFLESGRLEDVAGEARNGGERHDGFHRLVSLASAGNCFRHVVTLRARAKIECEAVHTSEYYFCEVAARVSTALRIRRTRYRLPARAAHSVRRTMSDSADVRPNRPERCAPRHPGERDTVALPGFEVLK